MAQDRKALGGFVGFANLPNQVHRRSVKKGFRFTLLVVGEGGLGKATLVNTLFGTQIIPPRAPLSANEPAPTAVSIKSHTAVIEEKGVRLTVEVLESVGFGDSINNDASWKPVQSEIEDRFDAYLEQERRVHRGTMVDDRIHCCLYFIPPSGHGALCRLRALDVELMKQVHDKVNLIPVIAKADTLTKEELMAFKKRIVEDLAYHHINTFSIETDPSDDAETINTAKELMSKVPFAVIGSEKEHDVGGKKVRGRKYPWGIIEVENEEHSDFVKLRQLLIRSHMEDLVTKTNEVLYEQYRTNKLQAASGAITPIDGRNPLSRFEDERAAKEKAYKALEEKLKSEYEKNKAEKEAKLEAEVQKARETYQAEIRKLENEKAELEARKRQLEEANRPPEKKSPKKKSGIFG